MLNQVVLVGKLKYVYNSFDVIVLDVDGDDIKIEIPYDLHNVVDEKRIGDLVAIKGKIVEGVRVKAERLSFIEPNKNLTNN